MSPVEGMFAMPGFLKVRSADGPADEFYAPEQWVKAHPKDYKVLEKKPVDALRAAAHVSGAAPAVASKSVGNSVKEES